MEDKIHIIQRDITINKKDILDILDFKENDIIFLSGSLIEGSINKLSQGMGNKLSDIDVFILSHDINGVDRDKIDYDKKYLKTQFKSLYGIDLDIEIYSKQVIVDLMDELNNCSFSTSKRTFNLLNLPSGFDMLSFTSFIHRMLNSLPIYNEINFERILANFNNDNYFKLMTRISVNRVDINYEDVIGNIENDQLEVAVNISRSVLIETVKAYIFYKKTSLDRDKWVPLKIKNLAKVDKEALEIYENFKKLYFEERLDSKESLQANAEGIINFSNNVICRIGQGGGI